MARAAISVCPWALGSPLGEDARLLVQGVHDARGHRHLLAPRWFLAKLDGELVREDLVLYRSATLRALGSQHCSSSNKGKKAGVMDDRDNIEFVDSPRN